MTPDPRAKEAEVALPERYKGLTAIGLVRQVARRHGVRWVSPKTADHVLWEMTGFPCFFATKEGEHPIEVLERQIEEAYSDRDRRMRRKRG